MKPNKQHQPSKEDIARQKQIEERIKNEKIEPDHPKGKERFERAIKQISKPPGKKKQ